MSKPEELSVENGKPWREDSPQAIVLSCGTKELEPEGFTYLQVSWRSGRGLAKPDSKCRKTLIR